VRREVLELAKMGKFAQIRWGCTMTWLGTWVTGKGDQRQMGMCTASCNFSPGEVTSSWESRDWFGRTMTCVEMAGMAWGLHKWLYV
jgi:hypothetical protein